MKILILSMRETGGGAERVAQILAEQWRKMGHTVKMAVGNRQTTDVNVREIQFLERQKKWARMVGRTAGLVEKISTKFPQVRGGRLAAHLLREYLAHPARAINTFRGSELYIAPGSYELAEMDGGGYDFLHIHNLHRSYFDIRALPHIAQKLPIICTLHDMWLLTGHCAYSINCNRWIDGCGSCPDLKLYPAIARDATQFNWKLKQMALSRSNLHIVTPSDWLQKLVRKSAIYPGLASSTVIHNGIDTSVFCPMERSSARKRFDLAQDAFVITFSHAGAKNSPFKDYKTFVECAQVLSKISTSPIIFITAGPGLSSEMIGGRCELRSLPRISDPREMAALYSASNVYLHPAKAENFSLSILEAMACGCPLVSNNCGGIPEQVQNDVNGYIHAVGDSEGMARSLFRILSDFSLNERLGATSRRLAVENFDSRVMAERYLQLGASISSHRR